jgi:hypothetical protein
MVEAPDYRSDRSESPEGRGIAYGRSRAFWESLSEDDQAKIRHEAAFTVRTIEDYPAFVRDQVTSTVVEDAELIGFWAAWHKAGGFAGLEAAGWHRATVYRKISRFRTRYGAHPDEHRFEWIKLDLKRVWSDELEEFLHPFGRPEAD